MSGRAIAPGWHADVGTGDRAGLARFAGSPACGPRSPPTSVASLACPTMSRNGGLSVSMVTVPEGRPVSKAGSAAIPIEGRRRAGHAIPPFPTREALVLEVYRHEAQQVADAAPRLLETRPPDQALREWMDRLARYAMTKAGLAEVPSEAHTRVTGSACRSPSPSPGRPGLARGPHGLPGSWWRGRAGWRPWRRRTLHRA